MNTKISAMLMAICATTSISAEETRQHGSHAHGLGELNIATEGNELIIEFISPSANIVGFEHAPGNSEETESVKKAQESLKQAESLFELSVGAACELEHVNIESALLSENETHADDDAHEEHEEHADEDEHEEHEEHADEDEHENMKSMQTRTNTRNMKSMLTRTNTRNMKSMLTRTNTRNMKSMLTRTNTRNMIMKPIQNSMHTMSSTVDKSNN